MKKISRRTMDKLIISGKSHSRTMDELKKRSGVDDDVAILEAISTCRMHGALIIDDGNGGYYRPETKEEVEEFRRRQPDMFRSIIAFRVNQNKPQEGTD